MHAHAQPIGGTLLNRPYKVILALATLGIALIVWRFAAGLGATTALSDGYPWGLWIAFDVVTGTALACGGYAMALLVYVFNKGRYHPLVRPAVLTSALGYSIAGLSVVIDVGRPWYIWRVPLYFWHWNLNSALLEVALCIMSYVFVLWIELSPAFLERWSAAGEGWLARTARKISPWINKSLVWILALGVLLPTMHQSSLGSLIVLTGPKLNLLWNTAFLPLLFLVSCLAMGYAAVVLESTLSNWMFGRPMETRLLAKLEQVAAWGMLGFVVLRLADLAWRGQFALALRADHYAVLFWLENLLMLSPFWAAFGRRENPGRLFRGAMFLVLGGALFRFDTDLVAFNPGPGWHYFPSVQEIFVTLGLVALEIAIYIALVRRFPILGALPTRPPVEVDHQEERTWLNAS
jgi:Ni/Fe-hydrogenase subunit HybB-like protein